MAWWRRKFIDPAGLIRPPTSASELLRSGRPPPCCPAYPVIRTQSSPLSTLLDAGHYGVVIDAVNARNFGKAEDLLEGADPKVFSFEHRTQFIETREILDLMGSKGYQPARLGDLLRFRIKHPRDRMIPRLVALNAVFMSGDRKASLCLSAEMCPGIVDLVGVLRDDDWDPDTRFLGVRLPPGAVYCPPPTEFRGP